MTNIIKKTSNLIFIHTLTLICCIIPFTSINAEDLIEVVLNDNLDFASNNNGLQPTISYTQFDTLANFTTLQLFNLVTDDFPVNIDDNFKPGSHLVKLKKNQNHFDYIKQVRPEHVTIDIPVAEGKKFTLALKKSDPLSDDFEFKDVDDNLVSFEEGLYYHGIVSGNATSWAAVSIFEGYMRALIVDYEGIYVMSAIDNLDEYYLLYNDKDLTIQYQGYCGVGESNEESLQKTSADAKQVNRNTTQTPNEAIRISLEADYSLFMRQDEDFQNLFNYVSATLNEAAILFENNSVNIELSELIVWNRESIYSNERDPRLVLAQLGERRKNDFNGDLLHLFTSVPLYNGGLAWVDALGKCYSFYPKSQTGYELDTHYGPYGLSLVNNIPCAFSLHHYDVWTLTHEIGHNLGSQHTHEPYWMVEGIPDEPLDNAYNGLYCDDPESGLGPCYDYEVPESVLYTTGGNIMSYYINVDSIRVSFYRGFGEQPGQIILNKVDNFFNKGCTDETACNYNPNAIQNDGSCVYGDLPNNDSIFVEFPWLNTKVNTASCNNESIILYTYFQEEYVLINSNDCNANGCEIYTFDGQLLTTGAIHNFDNIEIESSWTCRNCEGNLIGCDMMGIVFQQSCNGSDNYLIQTTDGTVIYPFDLSGRNYMFQTGDVIQFGISSTFDWPCVDYGVYLDCIEPVELPCTNTGTVIGEFCDNTTYTLIDMGSEGILDPYLSPIVNFQFNEGDYVTFAYMPISDSLCEVADKTGIVTCIQTICTDEVQINSVPIPDGVYNNAKHIISNGEVHSSSIVELKASRVTLDKGFKVEAGANFRVDNDGCE